MAEVIEKPMFYVRFFHMRNIKKLTVPIGFAAIMRFLLLVMLVLLWLSKVKLSQ